jgi:hypothetical protein
VCAAACDPGCCTKWRFFGDMLYLRPASDKISFAVPINGAITQPPGTPPVEVGKTAVADIDFQPGFRFGFSRAVGCNADVAITYTYFDGDANASTAIDDPFVLRSLVNHPGTTIAPTDFLEASASAVTRFHLVDVDYRRSIYCDSCSDLRYLAGVRYAHLDQSFASVLTNVTTLETVDTDINFDGFGLRVGLEGERRACSGIFVTGRGTASFVGGRFRNEYLQGDNFRGLVVDTGWKEDRLVSMLDLELGLGWASASNRFRIVGGYMVSAWYNTLRTNSLINSIRQTDEVDLHDTLTFDGFFTRAEVRF